MLHHEQHFAAADHLQFQQHQQRFTNQGTTDLQQISFPVVMQGFASNPVMTGGGSAPACGMMQPVASTPGEGHLIPTTGCVQLPSNRQSTAVSLHPVNLRGRLEVRKIFTNVKCRNISFYEQLNNTYK